MRVVVLNHEVQDGVRALRAAWSPHAPVIALDSGSRLAQEERALFDRCLPNVHYAAMHNVAVELLAGAPDEEVVWIVTSDVRFADAGQAAACAAEVFADPSVGTCAPAADASSHPTMRHRPGAGVVDAPFVEGFCYATRLGLLRAMTPIDTTVNRIGWGLDVHLAWRTRRAGRRVVVDHRVCVQHPWPSSYDKREARAQMAAWHRTLPPAARLYRALTANRLAHTRLGTRALEALPWSRW